IHFMLGYLISRTGFFQKLKDNAKLRRRLLIVSLIASAILIPVCYFYLPDVVFPFFRNIKSSCLHLMIVTGVRTIWQLWMIVSVTLYTTTLIGIYKSAKGKKWLAPFASFGQMCLSNYLIQSLVLVPYLLAFNKYDNMAPFSGFVVFICF